MEHSAVNGNEFGYQWCTIGLQGRAASTGASGAALQSFKTDVINSGSGVVAEAKGLFITNPQNTGGGSITENTGVYVSNQTVGTTDYGIYVAGADTYALFVDAGTTRLDGILEVQGNTDLQGNTTLGNATTDRLTVTSQILGGSPLVFQGATDDGFETTFAFTDPTADNTITFPNASGTVQLAPSSGSFLLQVPTATADNTITPTANSVVGLTVNGTSGTAATALSIVQGGAATALNINSTSTGSILTLQDGGTPVLTVADGGVTTISANGGAGVALTVNNDGSTGNILNIQDGGIAVATFADGGAVTFQNTANTISGFRVLNQAGTTTAFNVDTTNGRVGIGTSTPAATLQVSGAQATSAFGTSGMALRINGATYTDTGTAASGTNAFAAGTSYGIPTFAATNTGVTYTNAATLYISDAPTAGTNVTLTNRYALYVAAGNSIFGGDITTFQTCR